MLDDTTLKNFMARISTQSFLAFCHSLEGREVRTRAGRSSFTVQVVDGGLEFTLLSRKKVRRETRRRVDVVLDRFEKCGSFTTPDYHDCTVNSSYMLTLIDRYLKSRAA